MANNLRDLYCSKQRAKDILKMANNIRDLNCVQQRAENIFKMATKPG